MLKDSSHFSDSRVLMSVRPLPGRSEAPKGSNAHMPSRWPFTVERGGVGALRASSADKPMTVRKEIGNFIT
jgi:hypothetical protein